jgi:hypothetical protein
MAKGLHRLFYQAGFSSSKYVQFFQQNSPRPFMRPALGRRQPEHRAFRNNVLMA